MKKSSVNEDNIQNDLLRTHEVITNNLVKTAPSKSKRRKHKKVHRNEPLDVYKQSPSFQF